MKLVSSDFESIGRGFEISGFEVQAGSCKKFGFDSKEVEDDDNDGLIGVDLRMKLDADSNNDGDNLML
jgi:hypothetical protein